MPTTDVRPLAPLPLDPARLPWDLLATITNGAGSYAPLPGDDRIGPNTGAGAGNDATNRKLAAAFSIGAPIDADIAVVVATSGSTGTPKGAQLTAANLRASAAATESALGGPGQWALALPPHHIAGLQVILRSLEAGHLPEVIDVRGGFDPVELITAAAAMTGARRYISLVPTQLVKLLDHADALAALASFDAVLLGGAAARTETLSAAAAAGVRVVRSYGSSETAGGCVYDGVALPGARIEIAEDSRIWLGGNTIARGYRNLPDHPAFARAGWYRTDDAGAMDSGVLRITGRVDAGISTGGLTIAPEAVEAVLRADPDVADVAVIGIPDPRLGEAVAAAIVPAAGATPDRARLVELVARDLEPAAAPRHWVFVHELPLMGIGKIDRGAVATLFAR